jgi:hypothetical protein
MSMGFLEDLVRSMQEASQEAQQQQRQQRRSGPTWQAPVEAKQANVVRRERKPTIEPTQISQPDPPAPVLEKTVLPSVLTLPPSRFAVLLRKPGGLRDALILSELMQKPMAMRNGLLKSPWRR